MNISDMERTAEQVSDLMKVLSSRHRLMILCQLVEGERSVNDLAALLGLRSTAVSQQLALLRKDRIVQTRREGQTIYYSLARADVRRVIEVLYDIYCRDKQS